MSATQTFSPTRTLESIDLSGLSALVRTEASGTMTLLRWTLAVVFFPHGAQKMLGWFGGPGFDATMSYFTQMAGLPAIIALLVILIEFFGSIGLALGLLSRVAAAGVAALIVGAVLTTHLQFGFFMNWTGAQAGEGFEYHLLVLGIALAIMIKGSGALSLDRTLAPQRVRRAA